MKISESLDQNRLGHLTIGGADTVSLAQTYGTPLYVMDENLIRKNCRSYKHSIDECYNGKGLVAYASKALCCKAICRIAMEEGIGIDVVSGGELYTAKSVSFPPEKIIFHGNNKSADELAMAIEYGVGRIVVDNISELRLLNSLAKAFDKKVNIFLRIKPGIDAHTHSFVRTGQIDSKFGFALETGEAENAAKEASTMENLSLIGIHCHIGSQIFDTDPFVHAAKVMISFMAKLRDENILLTELNLGGGFGIKYLETHDPEDYAEYMKLVSSAIKSDCEKLNMPVPFIIIEPGRSIVGPAGITLYRVGELKVIPNVRKYLSIDGGMFDNPRYMLYKSDYTFEIANKISKPKDDVVTVCGKCCESGDLLGENIPLQSACSGDILAVLATGAYNYSMASNYNRNTRPPIVMVKDSEARLVVQRESLDDLIKNDL